jgi:hypothetical protein
MASGPYLMGVARGYRPTRAREHGKPTLVDIYALVEHSPTCLLDDAGFLFHTIWIAIVGQPCQILLCHVGVLGLPTTTSPVLVWPISIFQFVPDCLFASPLLASLHDLLVVRVFDTEAILS